MNKQILRKEILEQRNALTPEEKSMKSLQIHENLFALDEFKQAKTILFYASYSSEVQTLDMIKEALRIEKRVVIPIADFEENSLMFSELKNPFELEPNSRGIPEPKKEFVREVPAEELELVIVPGVAFSSDGTRLGQGGGFYDRFLPKLVERVMKVGLAYEAQVLDEIPNEDHDAKVDKIVTEKRVVECAKDQ